MGVVIIISSQTSDADHAEFKGGVAGDETRLLHNCSGHVVVTLSVQLIYEDHDPVEVILSQVTPRSVATLFDVSTILNEEV